MNRLWRVPDSKKDKNARDGRRPFFWSEKVKGVALVTEKDPEVVPKPLWLENINRGNISHWASTL